MWECRKCHERHKDAFDACWICGTSREGTEDCTFQPADDPAGSAPAEEDLRSAAARSNVCPKCGSDDMIPNVRIVDQSVHSRGDLEVEVYENPDALLFKWAHRGTLTASICGRCGYAEMYVSNAQELLATYRQGLKKQTRNV